MTWLVLSLFLSSPSHAIEPGVLACALERYQPGHGEHEVLAAGELDLRLTGDILRRGITLYPEVPEFGLSGWISTWMDGATQRLRLELKQNRELVKENEMALAEARAEEFVFARFVSGSRIISYYLNCRAK